MNKMIKASPVLASIMRSIRGLQNNAGRTQASQLTANGAKFVIRNPALLRILAPFRKAPNQVGSSPLSLRSAYSANYSEVQALKNRIAELINENQRLKGQYDQQNGHDKALYDALQAKHNNLNNQLNNLTNQVGNLTNQNGALVGQNANLINYKNTLLGLKNNALNWVNHIIADLRNINYWLVPPVNVATANAAANGTNGVPPGPNQAAANAAAAISQDVCLKLAYDLQHRVLPLINNV